MISLSRLGSPRLRPYESADEAAVLELLAADRLPGQPVCTALMLADALAGRSVGDQAAWAGLDGLVTTVLCTPNGGIDGIVCCAGRPCDDASLILWLHCRDSSEAAATLIARALEWSGARLVCGFPLASALTRGLIGLPERRSRATHEALLAVGFTALGQCRYLHAELPVAGLPHLGHVELKDTVSPAGKRLEVRRCGRVLAQVFVEHPVGGVGVIRSLTVAPDTRGQDLPLGLLGNAMDVLIGFGARETIVYLEESHDDPEWDLAAALRTYLFADFIEVDRLLTFTRPPTPSETRG
ncbi:GNAT family N-acetyltransferase [Streptomyces sp. NRRL S-1022]|uniref:GNAT family N-acetyltransferase n=1 Tax=Streptomyces sp. NRRL S-1022 TaxID=1463880 RepID=UPI001F36CDC7|nr:GNAT family N-acetyltransferase [Streptomyces sp. NRRL S-1022]